MKKTVTAAFVALLALTATGCGQDEKEAAAAPAATQEAAADENSFASFMQGTWLCEGETEFVRAHLPFPGMSVGSYRLDEGKFIVGDGTMQFIVDDGALTVDADWELEGRTLTVTTDYGTQVIENMPETFEYALEPVDTTFVGADGKEDKTIRIQALGERQISIKNEYASHCTKS
ncbi:hypothetical protein [Arthrobacter sp. zg-Y1110]|uniref:hypothetical protein n=1 Tax=Arthrobacter sp. zg-Y1110 TaxID=2886932 RepID=UPI001D144297|nr:hypothetical protein [Arthrobacter sp. zg-Y1110]MCC3292551.1 hypothetical protein [Arthrobacter sp. zg-Y1110]UWX87017.1 hypothetical protein N2K99_16840 [Arthrobacter sp. zg-Y1110]